MSPWLPKLHPFKLALLLPLPLLLIAFALGGESLTNQLLTHSSSKTSNLQADTHTVKARFTGNVLISAIDIKKESDYVNLELTTANSILKKLKFEVPTTELTVATGIIIQELGQAKQIKTLQSGTQIQLQSTVKVLGILATVKNEKSVTKVEVNTSDSVLKQLEFEFIVTDINTIKATLIQELGMSSEEISKLVSYRVQN
jgi:hypothetical protein